MRILIGLLLLLSFTACRERIRGNGDITTKTFNESGFTAVEISGPIEVLLSESNDYNVSIRGDANLMQYFIVENDGRRLKFRVKDDLDLKPSQPLQLSIAAVSLESVSLSGAGSIRSAKPLTASSSLKIGLSGAGDIDLQTSIPNIAAEISGSGRLSLRGRAAQCKLDISGAGDISCFGLEAERMDLSISGAADAEVHATSVLNVKVSGAGTVVYRGNPSVAKSINGAGAVRREG